MSLTDSLRFAYVCPLAWEKLTALRSVADAAPARHCESCQKTVTDLSGMSRTQADLFLASAASARDSVCVRIARDAAGRAVHRVPVSVPATVAGLAAAVVLSGCMASGEDTGGDTGGLAADTGDTAPVEEIASGGTTR